MQRLFQYLTQFRRPLWLAIFNAVLNKVLDLMPPFLTAWLIDAVSGQSPFWIKNSLGITDAWQTAIFLAILTFVIFGLESFFEWLYQRGFRNLAQEVQHRLRISAYNKLQSREMAFFESQRTGNLMAILNDDVNQLERFINSVFHEIVQMIVLVLFAGWSLCQVSFELGWISMIPIPFIVLGSLYYQRKVRPYYQEVRNRVGELGARLENNISGILVIKSFTAEPFESNRLREVSEKYRDAQFKAIKWNAAYEPLIRIFISIGFGLSLLVGAYWILFEPGRFSLGDLAFFAMMTQRLLWPVTRLGDIFDEYERARAASDRIFSLLDSQSTIVDTTNGVPLPDHPGNISFRDLHFAYQPGLEVLNGIEFNIRKGETLGIAGPTGGGKTTLIKLLLRLYEPTQGQILMEGIDLKDIALSDLRKNIALVSQDVYLFHGSVLENIAYGLENYSLEAVQAAAKKAQLHDFINSLPQQYDTIVGERGIKLSGGQRQRLSIARAILKDAPILILDEATSSVDTETERALQESLDELTADRTAIIIAHRLSTIRRADRIIVLKDGKISETGDHDTLVKLGRDYADLWRVQTGMSVV
ncbi:MAG TPA: ABC transporter ATP-binding protein [Saprospiraceae bacterium]|nr:ABC transporter ATP-binding protein [Saprospiraceae bacterium]HMQ84900.1 ABC transporter ATP-binding protein [Saprospiraceae bacterium]